MSKSIALQKCRGQKESGYILGGAHPVRGALPLHMSPVSIVSPEIWLCCCGTPSNWVWCLEECQYHMWPMLKWYETWGKGRAESIWQTWGCLVCLGTPPLTPLPVTVPWKWNTWPSINTRPINTLPNLVIYFVHTTLLNGFISHIFKMSFSVQNMLRICHLHNRKKP